jgi:hypothetical protein
VHGIERHRGMSSPVGSQGGISRVIIRYSDGRVLNFVADARRPIYSEDDLLELKKIISGASSACEWADINTRLGF